MQHLIIFAHPNPKRGLGQSFGRSIVEKLCEVSKQLGQQTIVRDLYKMNFDPVLGFDELQAANQGIIPMEVRAEQQLILQADLITIVSPLWWMGFPAILKGYLDRILSSGFAYRSDETGSVGLLQGKVLQQIITIGNDVADYQKMGFLQSLDHCMANGLFNFCGVTDVSTEILGQVHSISDEQRQQMLEQIAKNTAQKITTILQGKKTQHATE